MRGIELTVAEGLYEAWKNQRPLVIRLMERMIGEGESKNKVMESIRRASLLSAGAGWVTNDLEQVVDYIINQRRVTA